MMRLVAVAAASIILSHAPAAAAGQGASVEPIVQIGVFGYRADGSNGSAAYDTEPSLESRVYASGQLCRLGAGSREAPAWAMHAWRFSGRVLSRNQDEAVVQVTWQRTLDSGSQLPLPEHVIQLTIRAGDRVTLDTVHAPADSRCSMTLSFEARYMPRFSGVVREFGGGGAQPGSQARGTDGTGAGGATVRAGAGGVSAGPRERGSWMQVHLWLVHTAPDRKDEVVHQTVRAPQEGADFAFAPLSIDTARGPVVVQVSGSFGVADGQLTFLTNRSVKYLFDAGRNGAADTQGTGRTVNAMPAPDDVLSFEMPPIPGAPGSTALPNQLSVRVRMVR